MYVTLYDFRIPYTALTENIMTVWIDYIYSKYRYILVHSGRYYVATYTAPTRNIVNVWIEYLYPKYHYISDQSGSYYVICHSYNLRMHLRL